MRSGRSLLLTLVACAGLAQACGSSRPQIHAAGEFTPEMARIFNDSVDYASDVVGLGGTVASDWEREIDGLAASSDLIAVAHVQTVSLNTDADQTRSYLLTAVISNVIHGQAPDDHAVDLRVSEGQPGFNTVSGQENRIQTGEFVLFVKWYNDPTGALRAHWHLTPRSAQVEQRVRTDLGGASSGAGTTTTTHSS